MTIYVITPVSPHASEAHLGECVASVEAQQLDPGHQLRHLLVFDGVPSPKLGTFGEPCIVLPENTNDIGSTPRTIGAAYAWGLGADAVSFLDADCLYRPDHISRLLAFEDKTNKPVVCSGREILSYAGTHRAPCPEMTPGSGFFDTNTFLFTRDAIGLSYSFGTLTGREQHKIGDRILSQRAAPHLACHYHPTVTYRTTHQFHYERFGWPVPAGLSLKNLAVPG